MDKDGQVDRLMDGWICGCMDRQMEGWNDGKWMDGYMDEWIDGWMYKDGWID